MAIISAAPGGHATPAQGGDMHPVERSSQGYYETNDDLAAYTLTKMVYDVKSGYGATGDGVTNDTTAIQAALDAANATVGEAGVVLFPPGQYVCGSLTLTAPSGSNPFGAGGLTISGYGATLIGRASDTVILSVAPPSSPLSYVNGLTLEGFSLDMTAMANGATTYGISISRSYNSTIRDIAVIGEPALGSGLYFGSNVYTYGVYGYESSGRVKINGTNNTNDQSTTITFYSLSCQQVSINNAFGIAFYGPVIQGNIDHFVMTNCENITVMGGDLEGSGGYIYNFGTGVTNVTSIGNSISGYYTHDQYATGVAYISNLSDRRPQFTGGTTGAAVGTMARVYGQGGQSYTGTGPVTIHTFVDVAAGTGMALLLVVGDNGTAGFTDLVACALTSTIAMSSNTSYGSPPTRTYSYSTGNVRVTFGSSVTMHIRVTVLENLGSY